MMDSAGERRRTKPAGKNPPLLPAPPRVTMDRTSAGVRAKVTEVASAAPQENHISSVDIPDR